MPFTVMIGPIWEKIFNKTDIFTSMEEAVRLESRESSIVHPYTVLSNKLQVHVTESLEVCPFVFAP